MELQPVRVEGRDHPFMLSGGLTPETVAEALAVTVAQAVDVSSGVESSPGRKDPDRIAAFVAAAKKAAAEPQIAPAARRA
jgi:phosphoribosylanthranilate isomerase